MSDKLELLVTFGKQSMSLVMCTQDPQSLHKIKSQIFETFGLDPKYQRLVHRGRDVKTATVLTNGCKLLVLRNSSYYEHAVTSTGAQNAVVSAQETHALKTVSKASEIDVNDLEDNVRLVQIFRGKTRYDMIFPHSASVLDVKMKVSSVVGLMSPQALKLVVKGKIPANDTVLETLAGTKKVIKCLMLLQGPQHVMEEREKELRELINELAGTQIALQRVQRQMARNCTSRDESLFNLSRVLDDGLRLSGNLALVKQQLSEVKTAESQSTRQTIVATMQAIEEANTLVETAQKLLERHSMVER